MWMPRKMKKNNITSLSVHKNNLEQRRKKRTRQKMMEAAKFLKSTHSTEGFFFVSWDKKGTYFTQFYDPSGTVGKNQLPYFVGGAASRMVADYDAEDRDK